MTRDTIFIPRYGWRVDLFLLTDCRNAYEITGIMRSIGASDNVCAKAWASMTACEDDSGLTYSSSDYRNSVLVVYEASSAGEFLNTLMHELTHVAAHIVRGVDGDMDEETFCSLTGYMAGKTADSVVKALRDMELG